jgi:hypothetical protein
MLVLPDGNMELGHETMHRGLIYCAVVDTRLHLEKCYWRPQFCIFFSRICCVSCSPSGSLENSPRPTQLCTKTLLHTKFVSKLYRRVI